MKKRALIPLLLAMTALILDSRCAAQSARDGLELCIRTLIPGLFPMLVLSAMLVPHLSGIRIPGLSGLLGIPGGSEGYLLLGCAGGFPVGAASVVQSVGSGGITRQDAQRMLGITSFCGPAFLFGIIGSIFSPTDAAVLFVIQLETAVLAAIFTAAPSATPVRIGQIPSASPAEAVKRSVSALASVCAWVTLASVAAGFLRRWIGPMLPDAGCVILSGIMELTNGVFASQALGSTGLGFVLCAGFVCFGGVSVLLQIAGLAAEAGLSMGCCVFQKTLQGLLGALLAALYIRFGPVALTAPLLVPAVKIAVEISGRMVYNGPRKEGI